MSALSLVTKGMLAPVGGGGDIIVQGGGGGAGLQNKEIEKPFIKVLKVHFKDSQKTLEEMIVVKSIR